MTFSGNLWLSILIYHLLSPLLFHDLLSSTPKFFWSLHFFLKFIIIFMLFCTFKDVIWSIFHASDKCFYCFTIWFRFLTNRAIGVKITAARFILKCFSQNFIFYLSLSLVQFRLVDRGSSIAAISNLPTLWIT